MGTYRTAQKGLAGTLRDLADKIEDDVSTDIDSLEELEEVIEILEDLVHSNMERQLNDDGDFDDEDY